MIPGAVGISYLRPGVFNLTVPPRVDWSVSCAICLLDLSEPPDGKDDDNIVVRLPCQHTFHRKCIQRWFDKHKSDCPLCRGVCSKDDHGKPVVRPTVCSPCHYP
eukprot:COSAG01_NODE_1236_length_11101_cov_6.515179_6_plen_104_part_00